MERRKIGGRKKVDCRRREEGKKTGGRKRRERFLKEILFNVLCRLKRERERERERERVCVCLKY